MTLKHRWRNTLLLCCVIQAATAASHAEVLHWFRFEDDPGFLVDSITGLTLRVTDENDLSGPIPPDQTPLAPYEDVYVQTPLPRAEGNGGLHFPVGFAGNGSNSKGLDVTALVSGSRVHEAHGLFATGSTTVTGSFTAEFFLRLEKVAGFAASLAGQAEGIPANVQSWFLKVRNDGVFGSRPYELVLDISDGSTFDGALSDFIIYPGFDYYAAASFDAENSQVRYYVKNLSVDGELKTSGGAVSHTQLLPIDTFGVNGHAVCHCFANSLLDEIRFSRGVVPEEELLINLGVPSQEPRGPIVATSVPQLIFGTAGQSVDDYRFEQSGWVAGNSSGGGLRMLAKFSLPEFQNAATLLESAVLRFHLLDRRGSSALSLWHSALDNNIRQSSSSAFDDATYQDTGVDLIESDESGFGYFEVDVTDLVLADYKSDSGDPVTSFRLHSGVGRFLLSMSRDAEFRPELVLNFAVPEPSSVALLSLGVVGVTVSRRSRRHLLTPAEATPSRRLQGSKPRTRQLY